MLIILDRDGVINHESEHYVKNPDEWIPITNSLAAITYLNQVGHTVVVATNQAGVGRGIFRAQDLEAIHTKMHQELSKLGGHIDKIYFCPHHPDDHCECRKPRPGMLLAIQADYPDLFAEAIFIGDSWRDIQAAQAAACRCALVKTGYGEATLAAQHDYQGIDVFADLADFVASLYPAFNPVEKPVPLR